MLDPGFGPSGHGLTNATLSRNIMTGNCTESLALSPQSGDTDTNAHINMNTISCGSTPCRFPIECNSDVSLDSSQTGWQFNDNYWVVNNLGNSLVSCGSYEEARNYFSYITGTHNGMQQFTYGNEVSCDAACSPAPSVHDNYVDGRSADPGNSDGWYVTGGANNTFVNNNVISVANLTVVFEGGTGTESGTTHSDFGVMAPLAAG